MDLGPLGAAMPTLLGLPVVLSAHVPSGNAYLLRDASGTLTILARPGELPTEDQVIRLLLEAEHRGTPVLRDLPERAIHLRE